MADVSFNVAKGAARQLVEDNPDSMVLLLLKAAEADDTLQDYDDLSTLLAAGGNTEADFTNYARKTGLTEITNVDDTNNRASIDVADQTFTSAGGASNNTLVKAIFGVQTGAGDSDIIPLFAYDAPFTTDGTDLIIQIHADGLIRIS